jgi:hypothetical protein
VSARRISRPYPTQPVVEALLGAPAFSYKGDKKYVRNLSVDLPTLPDFDLEAIGYTQAKWASLLKFYTDDAEIERARRILARRDGMDVTSVAVSMRGQGKGEHSQGWCLESMVIVQKPRETHVTVYWRSSEVVKKLAADFVLLRHVLAQLGLQPASVHLHFATAWLGLTFAPLLLRTGPLIAFLDYLKSDRTMWMSATNLLSRYLDTSRVPKYAPEKRQQRYMHETWSTERLAQLREYLCENGRSKAA